MTDDYVYQYSDKIGYDGILVVRGNSYAELSKNLEEIAHDKDFLSDINSFRQALGKEPVPSHDQAAATLTAAFPAATMQPPVQQQAAPQQQGHVYVPAPQQQAPQQAAPSCPHGPRVAKSGTSKKGPWSGWMCAAKACDPIWN